MNRLTRRGLLAIPFLGMAGGAYARFVEPEWLEFTERTCPIPGLDKPVSIVHLSDLHASEDVSQALIERAIGMAVEARPDAICVTGDFVTHAKGFDAHWYATVLRKLSSEAPTYAVMGNHDGGLWAADGGGFKTTAEVAAILRDADIDFLDNTSRVLPGNLQLVGVGDMWAGELDAARAFATVNADAPSVVLSHNPDSKSMLSSQHWNLMLSGHTHGGQVVAPLLGASPAPVFDRAYIRGLKPWHKRWIHVSCGVGNIQGVRFNCRPEVTRLRLVPTKATS